MADFIPPTKKAASPFADMRGHHVAVRTPSLAEAKDFYVGKLDFRAVAKVGVGAHFHSPKCSPERPTPAAMIITPEA